MIEQEKEINENIEVAEELEENVTETHIETPEHQEFAQLYSKNNEDFAKAVFEYCFLHNLFFHEVYVNKIISSDIENKFFNMPELYIDMINNDFRCNGLNFFDQLKIENFEKIYSEDLNLLMLSEDDKKNRQACLDIIGYDPFKDEAIEDRPQLYRDLTGMLTDAMRKDIAKSKAALSIVRSYQNIEKYQRKVTELTSSGKVDEDTQKTLDQYLKVIATIQTTINQTAEKNNFTVRGIGSNGKGMLSDVMNQIEDMGIDEGITNFYDIETSKSIEEVANISFKAQLNQLNLSKTDYVEILSAQAQAVKEAQKTAAKANEALRLAKEKITKQELLIELEKDYRKKGISEEEITEFIGREYKLYDGEE